MEGGDDNDNNNDEAVAIPQSDSITAATSPKATKHTVRRIKRRRPAAQDPYSDSLGKPPKRSKIVRPPYNQNDKGNNVDGSQKTPTIDESTHTEDPEEILYEIKNSGRARLKFKQLAALQPWHSLSSEESVPLDDKTIKVGNVVAVRCARRPDGVAKVTEIRRLDRERHLLLLAWYYTRDEIHRESGSSVALDMIWPLDAPFTYMLSSNRTIVMWDTLRGTASSEVMQRLCPDMFYITTNSTRRIHKTDSHRYKWMQGLLNLH
jgi:hypothetical protein